jgi:hypothetical protein
MIVEHPGCHDDERVCLLPTKASKKFWNCSARVRNRWSAAAVDGSAAKRERRPGTMAAHTRDDQEVPDHLHLMASILAEPKSE